MSLDPTLLTRCHELGYAFMPLSGKVAILKEWQIGPAAPLNDVLAWAKTGNIGLRTGAASGIVVIDVDEGGVLPQALPKTVSVQTGNGMHYYFRMPSVEFRNTANRLAAHVDTRGEGGYVVFPGSVHPETGAVYEFINAPWDTELADVPEWVLEAIKKPVAVATTGVTRVSSSGDSKRRYVVSALNRECEDVAACTQGERNHRLNTAAYKMGGYIWAGLSESEAESALLSAALACGLPEGESRKTIASGLRAGRMEPREIPERSVPVRYERPAVESVPVAPTAAVTAVAAPATPAPAPAPAGHFRCIGFSDETYYFHSTYAGHRVFGWSVGQMDRNHLVQLAPLQWWELNYAANNGVSWAKAQNDLVAGCIAQGIFSKDKMRGRGAWWDNGHSVLHMGDHLIIDGERADLDAPGLKYYYCIQKQATLTPPGTLDRRAILDACESLSWQYPEHGRLLAGWLAIANLCGCLTWRPHIWIVGARGTGKTTVMDLIVARMLCGIAERAASSTTEAGLRQRLKSDARPVVFDEMEGDSDTAQGRVNRILELVRQASSGDNAPILKGTTTGDAQDYLIRSMFCFSSINATLTMASDESRITMLTLEKPRNEWSVIQKKIHDTFTDEQASALLYHMVGNIPALKQHIKTFSKVIGNRLHDQRHGDQLGTLIAGWWMLKDGGPLTLDDARMELEMWDLEALTGTTRDNAEALDEHKCLSYILDRQIFVEGKGFTLGNMSIRELVKREPDGPPIPPRELARILGRVGIAIQDEGIAISNTNSQLADRLKGKPWAIKWSNYLKRLPGAKCLDSTYFGPGGGKTRAVRVPWGLV